MDLEALEALEYLATKALQPLPPNQDQPFLSTILFQDFRSLLYILGYCHTILQDA